MEVDGEYVGRVRAVSLEPAKQKLRVIAPENPTDGIFTTIVKTLVNIPRMAAQPRIEEATGNE